MQNIYQTYCRMFDTSYYSIHSALYISHTRILADSWHVETIDTKFQPKL